MATDRRILEMALKGLGAERDKIDEEIADLEARLGGRSRPSGGKKQTRKKAGKKRRKKMSSAQRQLISERMKKAWARRKAGTKKS